MNSITGHPDACAWATSPARSSEDFPDPDGPKTTRNRCSRTFASTSPVSRSRPKKRSASSGWNADSPAYGALRRLVSVSPGSAACALAAISAATACHRVSHARRSPWHASTYASVTARLGNVFPPAASDSVVDE
ncbi:hypothetical protein OG534_37005 [Streptomyces sp. NBC_01294]|nr:hypothetical protein [Streptomyces sp. NBC_01294]WRZ61575.1 hypothetical protein OG534_37005 [Streptomyces sp. NBC_01294]